MRLGNYEQQPRERESYTMNYEDALSTGDYLPDNAAVLQSVEPADLVVDQITTISPRVRFFASGGTDKTTYLLTFLVTSADGRTFEDEVQIKVKETR